jgi:hypothetical protein
MYLRRKRIMTDIFRELKKDVDFDFGVNDAYAVVSQMLVEWCETRGRRFSDLIIKLKVGDDEYNVFESFAGNGYCFISDWDWYEGEDKIQILDIKRLDDVFNDEYCNVSTNITKNLAFPSYKCKSCNGEWVSVRYDYCPWCGRRIKY